MNTMGIGSMIDGNLYSEKQCPRIVIIEGSVFGRAKTAVGEIILVTELAQVRIIDLKFYRPGIGVDAKGQECNLQFLRYSPVRVDKWTKDEKEHFVMLHPHITEEAIEEECKKYPPPPGSSILKRLISYLRRKYGYF